MNKQEKDGSVAAVVMIAQGKNKALKARLLSLL